MKWIEDKAEFQRKWENYWYHYKMRTFAVAFAVTVIITSVYQCATTVKPDFIAMYVGYPPINDESIEAVQTKMAEIVGDLNNDKKLAAILYGITASLQSKSELDIAGIQKADLEISVGDSTLIFVNEEMLKRYVNMGVLTDVSEYIKKMDIDSKNLIRDKEDKFYCAVNITDYPFSSNFGLKKDLYMAIRFFPQNKKNDQMFQMQYKKSIEIFERILKNTLK